MAYGKTDLEMEIAGVSYDSRATQPGDLFVAMTGYATDGHKYIATALEKGAAAVLCQNLPEGEGPKPHDRRTWSCRCGGSHRR